MDDCNRLGWLRRTGARRNKVRAVHGGVASVLVMVSLLSAAEAQACTLSEADTALIKCDGVSDHPLCGKIYATKTARAVPDQATTCADGRMGHLADAVAAVNKVGGVVILGEVHDNPDHHQLRAHLISAAGAIVFEQIKVDQDQSITTFFEAAGDKATVEGFKRAVEWDKSGWDQTSYDPLLAAVLGRGKRIYAGDAARADLMAVAKKGVAVLPTADSQRLGLMQPLGEALDQASLTEIEEAHCGMLPKQALPGMAAAQRYRDAQIAQSALTAAERNGSAVVIAGNNHARTDRGVPWYVRTRNPERPVLSVMFVEVIPGKFDVQDYIPRAPSGDAATDFIVMTAPVKRTGDPCAAFQKKKMKT
jgi:uncharacterized iron-regulated protein